ncbi:RNA-directed DNA polymerase, eukaryota [Tanacetum coccineum]|uniref:RNA-directed DNA polymerase, eukaryota n=1 Tax=Tanacetum coccineum TaxID=301880 RepID=A0ABQ5F696_9ASTR
MCISWNSLQSSPYGLCMGGWIIEAFWSINEEEANRKTFKEATSSDEVQQGRPPKGASQYSDLHGLSGHVLSADFNSTWSSIITEVNSLKVKGVDLISHCKIRVGKGTGTSFWKDLWIGDNLLKLSFPRLFALEENKDISVADKMNTSISSSFRRHVRGGVESQQLDQLSLLLDTVILSNMDDRWFWDLNGDGVFQVKDVRSMLDEAFLPKMEVPTRWIKSIPIKVNVFAWKLYLDRLPTRSNLSRRNVSLPSLACPLCDHVLEDSSHLFFGCSVAKDIQKLICRWWNLDVHPYESYEDWLSWFKSIRLGSKTKEVLEGVFYVSWSNNDINVINRSSLLNDLKQGIAPDILFVANDVTYPCGYYLCDGIYSEWVSFNKSVTNLVDDDFKRLWYKRMHEEARKDVERAFGAIKTWRRYVPNGIRRKHINRMTSYDPMNKGIELSGTSNRHKRIKCSKPI